MTSPIREILFNCSFFVPRPTNITQNVLLPIDQMTQQDCQIDVHRPREFFQSLKTFYYNLRTYGSTTMASTLWQRVVTVHFYLFPAPLTPNVNSTLCTGTAIFYFRISSLTPSFSVYAPQIPYYESLSLSSAQLDMLTESTYPYAGNRLLLLNPGKGYQLSSLTFRVQNPPVQNPIQSLNTIVNENNGSILGISNISPLSNSAYSLQNNPPENVFPVPPPSVPVIGLPVITNAVITSITFNTSNFGYFTAPSVTISPPPVSTPSSFLIQTQNGKVTPSSVTIQNKGSQRYTPGAPRRVQAILRATTIEITNIIPSTGAISEFEVTVLGTNYPPNTTTTFSAISVTGVGKDSTFAVTTNRRGIAITVTIQNPGESYQIGNVLSIPSLEPTDGIVVPEFSNGEMTSVSRLQEGNQLYTLVNDGLFNVVSVGTQAVATASIENGRVIGFSLNPENTNYNSASPPSVTISPPTSGTQATGRWDIDLQTFSITGIQIFQAGSGYDPLSPPSLQNSSQPITLRTIPQQTAIMKATGLNENGSLEKQELVIISGGSGYIFRNPVPIEIIDPNQSYPPFVPITVVDIDGNIPSYIKSLTLRPLNPLFYTSEIKGSEWMQAAIELENAPLNALEIVQFRIQAFLDPKDEKKCVYSEKKR